jgi:hypothetical protein
MSKTRVMRVPAEMHQEAVQLAALRRQQPGAMLAAAWAEYMENHRDEFANDLEQAAQLLRDGTLDQLADFASRDADARAQAAADRARAKRRS